MSLCRVVHHRVGGCYELTYEIDVCDISDDEFQTLRRKPLKRGPGACVSHFVENCHTVVRVLHDVMDEV
ncbi:hypothetical protein GCM10009650_06870 [Nesterenkonia jeotgali]